MNRFLLGVVVTFGLHAGLATAATIPCSGLPGSLSDPAGDAFFFGGPTPSPDIVCAGAEVSGGNLLLRVGFAPGTFDPATTKVVFNLDIDQNPATGFSGITNGHADSAVMGVEYVVEFGSNYNIGLAWVETVPGLSVLGTGPVELFDDGMEATILLSLLGDDGLFNFKATVQTQNPPTQQFPVSFTIIQDFASDLGLAPGTTAIAEPATLSLFGVALFALACGRRKEFGTIAI